ncbi:MAG TPA: NADH-quinone oxidoreductase subunit J, partial [Frankiaceae bacterium]|nr:NADH-quinone oxidoreductase subunit J [Frankiaceae bacterium]
MTGALLAAPITSTSGAEAAVFWVLAPIALGSAIAMVLARNAVHAALLLVLNFFCLAAFYFVQEAPFLGAVQIIVYTGAIMVLFLFVLMLVGVDSSDSLVETLRGQRVAAILLGIGFTGVLVFPIGHAIAGTSAAGLGPSGFADNVHAIARVLFTTYVFAFEVVSALLVIAAVGAMVLGHRERVGPRRTQRELSKRRFVDGRHVTPLPGPGVYARHDAVDQPAMLPSGEPSRESLFPEFADEAAQGPVAGGAPAAATTAEGGRGRGPGERG